ncbi:hypothetical protein MPSEU_000140700 [Mayamaea pseudoterrestris]|nr:hypothetical protein MPSEU_000140700 [Mayamaea pseudoterrestris]
MNAPGQSNGGGDDSNNGGDDRNNRIPKQLFPDDSLQDYKVPSHVSVQTHSTADLTPQTEFSSNHRQRRGLHSIPEQVHSSRQQLVRRRSSLHSLTPATAAADTSNFSVTEMHPRLRQIAILSGTTAASTVALLASILPMAALLSLGVLLANILAILYLTYLYANEGFQNMIHTRGIGPLLPSRWYQMLTEQSVHDWMTDDAFIRENRHLMLYFFPGLTPAQRTDYIERLAPRHRQQLLRPGVGYFLGDYFMRLLMGEERYQATVPAPPHYPETTRRMQRQPAIEVIMEETPRMNPSRQDTNVVVDDDDESDLHVARNASHLADALTDEQAVQMIRSLGIERRPSRGETAVTNGTVCGDDYDVASLPEEDSLVLDEIDYEEEERVLTEAFMNSMYDGIWAPFQRYWVRQLRPMADTVLRFSASVTLASLGLGALAHGQRHRSLTIGRGSYAMTLSMPSSRLLLGTAMAGGFATGATMLFRWQWLQPARRRPRSMTPRKSRSNQSFGSGQYSNKKL